MTTTLAGMRVIFRGAFFVLLSQAAYGQFQGRIFTTEEERAYLDVLRANFLTQTREPGFDIATAIVPALPEAAQEQQAEAGSPLEYTLGGILTRGDGSHTIWLNGQPISEAALPSSMEVTSEGSQVMLSIRVDGSVFRLKPGQTLNASSGVLMETYERDVLSPDENVLNNSSDATVQSVPEAQTNAAPAPAEPSQGTDTRETP